MLSVATVGLLPPGLRHRFGLRWSRGKELELRALGATMRAATPLMPDSLRNTGPNYLRARRKALERRRRRIAGADRGDGPRVLAAAA